MVGAQAVRSAIYTYQYQCQGWVGEVGKTARCTDKAVGVWRGGRRSCVQPPLAGRRSMQILFVMMSVYGLGLTVTRIERDLLLHEIRNSDVDHRRFHVAPAHGVSFSLQVLFSQSSPRILEFKLGVLSLIN